MSMGKPLNPIIWGVRLDDEPPCFEILFLARLDDDHRVARVPFAVPPRAGTPERDALMAARKELDRLSSEAVIALARAAELTDRSSDEGSG